MTHVCSLRNPSKAPTLVFWVYSGQTKLRCEVKRGQSSLFLGTWSVSAGLLESGGCSGAPLLALPSACLLLYVWMPLRQDVTVCGLQSARSGKNEEWLRVEVVFKVQACFHPGVSSPQGWLKADAPPPRGLMTKALLTVCSWGITACY